MTNTTPVVASKNLLTIANAPLDQFEVMSVYSAGETILFNNLSLVLMLNLGMMLVFLNMYNFNLTNNFDFILRNIYQLVQSVVRANLYIRKQQYFAVLFYLFLTLFVANLVGLLPYSFTVTSSFIVTLFISLLHFIGVNIVGASQHG